MIQRIQSLFLLVVILLAAILFYLPVFKLEPVDVGTDGNYWIANSNGLLIVNCVVIFLSLIAIFMFKRRDLQKKICSLNLMIISGFVGLLFFLADSMGKSVHYVIGSYVPLFMLLFTFLALRYIKRDDNLVRSADRLRA